MNSCNKLCATSPTALVAAVDGLFEVRERAIVVAIGCSSPMERDASERRACQASA